MANDLAERLRARADQHAKLMGNALYYTDGSAMLDRAAAARIEQLEAALWEIASDDLDYASGSGHESAILTARAALAAPSGALEEETP